MCAGHQGIRGRGQYAGGRLPAGSIRSAAAAHRATLAHLLQTCPPSWSQAPSNASPSQGPQHTAPTHSLVFHVDVGPSCHQRGCALIGALGRRYTRQREYGHIVVHCVGPPERDCHQRRAAAAVPRVHRYAALQQQQLDGSGVAFGRSHHQRRAAPAVLRAHGCTLPQQLLDGCGIALCRSTYQGCLAKAVALIWVGGGPRLREGCTAPQSRRLGGGPVGGAATCAAARDCRCTEKRRSSAEQRLLSRYPSRHRGRLPSLHAQACALASVALTFLSCATRRRGVRWGEGAKVGRGEPQPPAQHFACRSRNRTQGHHCTKSIK